MMTKKFLALFVLASLAGHALVLALTTRIDWTVSPPAEQAQKVITVELKGPPEKAARRPYRDYLLQVRRKIAQLWSYPPQAIETQEEGNAVIRFTIDANGSLSGYDVVTTSGSTILDQGALAVVKAAAPYAPIPVEFNLSRLHITATLSYRMTE